MHDQIQEAFDGIKASEALKARTRSFVAEQTERRQRSFFPAVPAARWIAAAACALLLFLGGYRLYEAPTVAISVDINPSIELEVNRFGRVVSVSGYNEAGKALLERLPLRNKPYAEAIEAIASDSQIRSLLSNDETLVFFVAGAENAQTSQILSDIESFTAGRQNMVCRCGDEETAREAHALGLSCGRYAAYLELKAFDPDVTPEDVNSMTMREIRDRIAALSGEDPGRFGEGRGNGNGNGQGSGNGSGQGNGQGSGNGSGQGNGQGAGNGNGKGKG